MLGSAQNASPIQAGALAGASPAHEQASMAARRRQADIWRARGNESHARGELDAAAQAFAKVMELDPGDGETCLSLAVMELMEYGGSAEYTLELLRRCHAIAPELVGGQYWAAYACLLMEDYVGAVSHMANAVELAPKSAHYRFWLGWTQQRLGDSAAASATWQAMAELCMEQFNANRELSGVGHLVHALLHAGLSDEAARLLNIFTDRRNGFEPVFSHPEYLPDTPTRIRLLRALVRGRDLVILAYGPSMAGFEAQIERLAGADVCYFTFDRAIDEKVLSRIGRGADLFCVTAPPMMRANLPWFMDYLSRPRVNMLITHGFAVDGAKAHGVERAWFEERFAERLLYFRSMQRHPPVPDDPLHFPPYNTLSVVTPLAVLGRPRRIFLFGCDGQVRTNAATGKASLFYSQDFHKYRMAAIDQFYRNPRAASDEQKAFNYRRMLHLETRIFNFQTPATLAWLSHVHRLEIPPIYNCCPTSAYEGFAKIESEQGLAMLESGGDLGLDGRNGLLGWRPQA